MAEYDPVKLESFVRQRAPEIARDIHAAAEKSHNEADLVAEVEKVLDKFATNFDIQLHLDRERTLINGRADAVYNRFVIEYEPPHSLQKSNTYRNNKHAIEQVQQYMGSLERLDRHHKERLAGVVLDGMFYIFVRFREGHWSIDDPLPVDTHSTETFLRYLLSLSTELALTPENLVRDFGENSNTARRVVPVLYSSISITTNKKANVLFQQWQRQFREVSGYDPESGQLDAIEVGRLYAVKDTSLDLEKLFFAIHTYYASFIKLLALQVANYYLMPKMGSSLASAANSPTDKLCKYLQDLEQGGLFKQLGICNFLEGDFFGWYLDMWDENLDVALRRLIGDLANYSLVTLDVDPEETRDLLKQLYQNLMPRELRHALGEYYTPDWLADRLLNQLGYQGDPRIRLLDPACGSGTFLVLAIKRVRAYAEEKMLPPAQVLDQILENLVGFDLNPLAVISARTNYLLALGDLLAQRKCDISIPVYLADSILTPSEGADLFSQNIFTFNTSVGRFSIPKSLVHAHYIDKLADLLEECVHINLSPDLFRQRLIKAFPFQSPKDDYDISITLHLFTQMLKLEEQGINGIWARIIKNAFAPLFQNKFDFVAGNPPWVNWESLPRDYREETMPLWKKYNLFTLAGWQARLGGGKKDISVLMTYASIDNYLQPRGKLGFVITQSVYKTVGASEGFRRFQLGNNAPFRVLHVDDMVALKPFENASNKTSVIIVEKGRITEYPVPYTMWRKRTKGIGVPEDSSLEEVVSKYARISKWAAEPIDNENNASPWMTGKPRSVKAVKRIVSPSAYQARSGACTWDNGIYWVEIVEQRPDGLVVIANINDVGRKETESLQTTVENDLLYPLMRGRDVAKWSSNPSLWILQAQDPNKRVGWDETWLKTTLPKTFAYFYHFKDRLKKRSGIQKYFDPEKDAFYSIYNVGPYTLSPYKVCWAREDKELRAAVVGKLEGSKQKQNLIIPDQTVQFVPCDDFGEAHYICALLNSSISNYIALGYTSDITTRIMNAIPIQPYKVTNESHKALVKFSQQAHDAATAGNDVQIQSIEAQVDDAAAHLWGLTPEELKEIQESLEELQ